MNKLNAQVLMIFDFYIFN